VAVRADATLIDHLSARPPERAVPQPTDVERDLQLIETTLRQLETKYNLFFAGQAPRPPWETRRRLEQMLNRLDRGSATTSADRFRLGTLQSRFATFVELWDRALRAREEGRAGPLSNLSRAAAPAVAPPASPPTDQVFGSTTLSNADDESDKVQALYDSVVEARRAVGASDPFPFSRFADIVKGQVARFHQTGAGEVAFRVSTREGRLVFTARGCKRSDEGQPE
jgi:hypothetical protein